MLLHAVTIFLGAFLLFEIEPIAGKFVLPWFGGSPAVWTTCLLFFQVLLLAGYLYAHAVVQRLSAMAQRRLHFVLLAFSAIVLLLLARAWGVPVLPGPAWKPRGSDAPVRHIVALLAVSIGLPYFLLAATSPLVQAFAARERPVSSVYRLYALSNVGSLLAPLTYPFLVEPHLPLRTQAAIWSVGYLVFTACVGLCTWRAGRSRGAAPGDSRASAPADTNPGPGAGTHAFWFALATCGSAMLLATTNQMCQEVAAIPFLWLLPLCLYLLSFIACFENERLYARAVFGPLLASGLAWAAFVLYGGHRVLIRTQVGAYSLALFAACMVCHGELARSKPGPQRLTSFYLTVAAGGAFGGFLVALAAPLLFRGFWEIHISLWLSGSLAIVALARDSGSWLQRGRPWPAAVVLLGLGALAYVVHEPNAFSRARESLRPSLASAWSTAGFGFGAALLVLLLWRLRRPLFGSRGHPFIAGGCLGGALGLLVYILVADVRTYLRSAVSVSRNFYGVLTVKEDDGEDAELRRLSLRNGRIIHGFQYQAPEKRRTPTAYYGEKSGIGLVLRHHPRRDLGPLRVGVVGLGAGTIAAYGRPGDTYRFYDINPGVVALSAGRRAVFTFLADSPARVEVVLGDARLSLEGELAHGSQDFDVLAIDAFSSDSIPVHLLTKEALAVYLAHLRLPEGVLALHISNRQLDLAPVVRAAADAYRLSALLVNTSGEGDVVWGATWVLLVRGGPVLETPEIAEASEELTGRPGVRLWTDDYSNLFRILK